MSDPFTIQVDRVLFPCVYRKMPVRDNPDLERHSVSFEHRHLSLDVAGIIRRTDKGLCRASSHTAPRVSEVRGRYRELADLFAELEVRNIPRDRLLADVAASLTLSTYEFNCAGISGTALTIHEVLINADDLLRGYRERFS